MRRNLIVISLVAILVGLIPIGCGGGSREPSVEQGQTIFVEKCSDCHNTTRKKKVGPGLRNLLKRAKNYHLPNGTHPSEEGVRSWILKGSDEHPVFPNMSDSQLDDLMEFLKTL